MSAAITSPTTLSSDYLESTDYLRSSTTTSPAIEEATLTASPTIMDMWMSQLQKDHPEISFVIPSQHDNQHIDNMVQFKRLLEQVGNTAYDTITAGSQHHEVNALIDSMGQTITHDQIKNSAVLNLADLKSNALTGLEKFFAGTDMPTLINYLWVGVVTSLIVLTVIFVLFSCYFYRKFREWKKCNKDIRAHFNNDTYPDSAMPFNAAVNPEAAYYQVESPPCYTIATGLPTYDEALQHTQQNFAFGRKFIYPKLAAVHHQASNLISSWEKYDITNKDQKAGNATPTTKCKSIAPCNRKLLQTSSSSSSSPPSSSSPGSPSNGLSSEASTAKSPFSPLLLPPSYAAVGSMLAPPHHMRTHASENTSSDLTDIITV